MKIAEIRAIIDTAAWNRRDLTGGTREEFRRQDVGGVLRNNLAHLRALEIAPRYARDIERRDTEIMACESVIARWEAAQETPSGHLVGCVEHPPGYSSACSCESSANVIQAADRFARAAA